MLTVLTAFTTLPIFVMLTSSIKPLVDVQGAFKWIPTHVTLSPYIDIWTTVPLAQYFVNSLIVSICCQPVSA